MSKIYKYEKYLREFSRKQHLNQHYNRKIPCMNPPNQILYYKDITNILPHGITSGNIIVNNILPTKRMQDDNYSRLEDLSLRLNFYQKIRQILTMKVRQSLYLSLK